MKIEKDIEMINVNELEPYKNNPKEHNEAQVTKIAKSIKDFGFSVPIITDDKNNIIAGHGRYLASKKLQLDEVPVIKKANMTEAKIKAFRLADNKVAESNWDYELLEQEILSLQQEGFADLTGFDDDEIQSLSENIDIDDFFEENEKDSQEKNTTVHTCPKCGEKFEG